MEILAKFYGDGLYHPAFIREKRPDGYLVTFVGYESDELQLTKFEDIIGSFEVGSISEVAAARAPHSSSLQHAVAGLLPTRQTEGTSAKRMQNADSVAKAGKPATRVHEQTESRRSGYGEGKVELKKVRQVPCVNQGTVNGLVNILREDFASQRKHVSVALIVQEVNTRLGVSRFEDLGLGGVRENDSLRQLAELEDCVNTFVQCYVLRTSVCTLHELHLRLVAFRNVKTFEDLKMGPLLKHPIVLREFQPSAHVVNIPEVTVFECAKALGEIMRNRATRDRMIEPKEIVERLMSARGVSDPHELCVRIKGLGLYISQLASCIKIESLELKEIRSKIEQEETRRYADCERKLRSSLDARFSSFCSDESLLNEKLAKVLTDEGWCDDSCPYGTSLLLYVQKNFRVLSPILQEGKKAKSLRITSVGRGHAEHSTISRADQEQVNKNLKVLLAFMRDTPLGRVLSKVLLSSPLNQSISEVHAGLEKEHDLLLRMKTSDGGAKSAKGQFENHRRDSLEKDLPPDLSHAQLDSLRDMPSRAEVIEQIFTLLQSYSNSVTLKSLDAIEQLTASKFDAPTFEALGYGSFLRFLCEEKELFRVLEDKFGNSTSSIDVDELLGLMPQAQRMMTDLSMDSEEDQVQFLRQAFLNHFRVSSCTASHLVEQARTLYRNSDMPEANVAHHVHYGCLLVGAEADARSLMILESTDSAKKAAYNLLSAAPFLFDLSKWTQWRQIFEPVLGSLDSFLRENQQLGIFTVKLAEGELIRVNPLSSCESLFAALCKLDSNDAATDIVSIVCLHGGVINVPEALIGAKAVGGFQSAILRAGEEFALEFVVKTAKVIPEAFRNCTVMKFLVNPLIEALGKGHTKCHELIIETVKDDIELKCIFRSLGMAHGIRLWTNNWSAMFAGSQGLSSVVNSSVNHCDDCVSSVGQNSVAESSNGLALVMAPLPIQSLVICSDSSGKELRSNKGSALTSVAKEVIEEIRKKEFGIGLELDGSGTDLRESLNARVGRALQRLSNELYSSDSHFLLELIQNADDNAYCDDVLPQLYFVKSEHYILVANNESGFSERDVRALCDIGKSTKSKKSGYIGQKGIGFKSVFRVSDAPQIHSNGYSIVFNTKKYGALGYILPDWVEQDALESVLRQDSDIISQLEAWATVIALPLKESHGTASNLFEDLSPSLLLFLKKLRRICVADPVAKSTQIFQRLEHGEGIVEVSCNDQRFKYLTVTRSFKPDVMRLDVEVESTDVVMAIPLPDDWERLLHEVPLQNLFAYLPVRAFGFRFIVQGDFILPSSRESVDRDSPWNQRLRAEIPAAFALAVEACKVLPMTDDCVKRANLWLAMLPLEAEVETFFRPCVRAIHAMVRTLECVLTTELQWVRPDSVVVCSESMMSLVDAEMLKAFLNLHVAHKDLLSKPLSNLGVSQVNVKTLFALLQAGAIQTRERLSRVVWFLADALAKEGLTPEEKRSLSSLPLLILSDGSFTSADAGLTYFSLKGKDGHAVSETAKLASLPLSQLIRVVHPDLENRTDGGDNKNVVRLLHMMGVKVLGMMQVMKDHIITEFRKPIPSNASEDLLIALLVFACQYWLDTRKKQENDTIISSLKDCTVILTTHGFKKLDEDCKLHLTQEYKTTVDSCLMRTMIALNWTFVSGKYCTRSSISSADWRDFFLFLGARDFVHVCSRQLKPTVEDVGKWKGTGFEDLFAEDVEITDFISDELEELFHQTESAVDRHRIMTAIAHYFDKHWKDYEQYKRAEFCGKKAFPPSTFLLSLMHSCWLPTADSTLSVPSSLWQASEAVCAVFHSLPVAYVDSKLHDVSFLEAIGVKTSPSISTVLEQLRCWSSMASFQAQISDMSCVYLFLGQSFRLSQLVPSQLSFRPDNATAKLLREHFQQYNLVFLPHKLSHATRTAEGQKLSGSFHSPKELRCYDKTRIFESISNIPIRILDPYYKLSPSTLNSFFGAQGIAVQEIPRFEDYIDALRVISQIQPHTSEQLNHYFALFSLWSKSIADNEISASEWEKLLVSLRILPVFPTVCGKSSNLQHGIYIPDDDDLAKVFHGSSSIRFLRTEYGTSSLKDFFHEHCRVPLLSQSVQRQTFPTGSTYVSKLSVLVRDIFPWMQRWIFWNYLLEYEDIAVNLEPRLSRYQTVLCSTLEQMITLNGEERPTTAGCAVLDGDVLYVTKSSAEKYLDVFTELSRLFFKGPNREFAVFASLLVTTKLSGMSVESVLETSGCHPLSPSCPQAESLSIPLKIWEVRLVSEVLESIAQDPTSGGITNDASSTQQMQPIKKREAVAAWPPPLSSSASAGGAGFGSNAKTSGNMRNHGNEGVAAQDQHKPAENAPNHMYTEERSANVHSNDGRPDSLQTPSRTEQDGNAGGANHEHSAGLSTSTSTSAAQARAPKADGEGPTEHSSKDASASSTTPPAASSSTGLHERTAHEDGQHIRTDGVGQGGGNPCGTGSAHPGTHRARSTVASGQTPCEGYPPAASADGGSGAGAELEDSASEAGGLELAVDEFELDRLAAEATLEDLAGTSGWSEADVWGARAAGSNKERLERLGRFGEALIVRYLRGCSPPATADGGVEVEWVNEKEESGASYDICTRVRGSSGEIVRMDYIEVKTTGLQDKDFFEITHGELRMAETHGPNYHIFRVVLQEGVSLKQATGDLQPSAAAEGAADDKLKLGSVRVVRVSDPVALWRCGRISVAIVL